VTRRRVSEVVAIAGVCELLREGLLLGRLRVREPLVLQSQRPGDDGEQDGQQRHQHQQQIPAPRRTVAAPKLILLLRQ
jgi:hypothetical protein